MLYQQMTLKDGKPTVLLSKEVDMRQLTSECLGIQFTGLEYCKTCEFLNTDECGGKRIRDKLTRSKQVFKPVEWQEIWERTWASKEKYSCHDFDYSFVLEQIDSHFTEEIAEGTCLYSLSVVKSFDKYTKEQQAEILSCCCITEEQVNPADIVTYGLGAPLYESPILKEDEEEQDLLLLAKKADKINKNFYAEMDRRCNAIGDSYWDAINGELGKALGLRGGI